MRLAKTRSIASKLCQSDHIRLNGDAVKPSKATKVNDIIALKTGGEWREFKVLDIPKSRLGAKLVIDYVTEITSEAVLVRIKAIEDVNKENRSLGIVGRPTKKSRRDLKRFTGRF